MKVDVEIVEVGNPEEPTNMPIVTVRNNKGFTVANLYVLKDGNLHSDSWICDDGWGSPEHTARLDSIKS